MLGGFSFAFVDGKGSECQSNRLKVNGDRAFNFHDERKSVYGFRKKIIDSRTHFVEIDGKNSSFTFREEKFFW